MLSIVKLPENVLIEAFSYLNHESLKSATLVCTQWNDIIGASPKLMRNFKLYLDAFTPWEEKIDELLSLKRAYQSMYILKIVPWDTLLKISAKHGSSIRNFSLFHGKILKADDFQELLKHMPLLEKLKVAETELNLEADEMNAIQPAQLMKLQSLKIKFGSSWTIFRYLVGLQPKYLDVSIVHDIESDEGTQSLMAFLKATKRLETLIFDEAFVHSIFMNDESESLFFRLKSLSFYCGASSISYETEARFCKFLEANVSSLDELVMRNNPSQEIHEAVFKHIKNLKKLNLTVLYMPNGEFYEKLSPMKSLLELECNGKIRDADAAKGLLGFFPNIKSLKVSDKDQIISDLTPFMATYNPNIETLKLDTITNNIEAEVKFKALKLLYVISIGNDESLKLLLKSNPTIETFGLRFTSESDIVDFLLTMPNIKHLKFGGYVSCLKEIFDKIVLAGVKHLETLEFIFQECRGHVLFELPADYNKWNSKCSYYENYEEDAEIDYEFNRLSHFK